MAFLAQLFNKKSGLNTNTIAQEVLDELDLENLDDLDNLVEEETREEETFVNWVNSLGISPISNFMPHNISRLYSGLILSIIIFKITFSCNLH
jgi:hypothetical protein